MLLHGCIRAHPIEELHLLAILLHDLSSTLVVACKHSSEHDKIGAGPCDQQSHTSGNGERVKDKASTQQPPETTASPEHFGTDSPLLHHMQQTEELKHSKSCFSDTSNGKKQQLP